MSPHGEVLQLDARPIGRRDLLLDLWKYRKILVELARADFKDRYKRALFGVGWAVVVPLVQAAVLAVVFSRALKFGGPTVNYPLYILSGVLAWSYFSGSLTQGSTAIVDGSELTEKVWFPRAMLPIVPSMSNFVGLCASMLALIVLLPLLGVLPGPRTLLLVVACLQLIAFTISLSLVLAALQVYFRDVRHLLLAVLLVWFYATPVIYPAYIVGWLQPALDFNPMTGILDLFRMATVGNIDHWRLAVAVSAVATLALLAVAIEVYRRHDRLFADLL